MSAVKSSKDVETECRKLLELLTKRQIMKTNVLQQGRKLLDSLKDGSVSGEEGEAIQAMRQLLTARKQGFAATESSRPSPCEYDFTNPRNCVAQLVQEYIHRPTSKKQSGGGGGGGGGGGFGATPHFPSLNFRKSLFTKTTSKKLEFVLEMVSHLFSSSLREDAIPIVPAEMAASTSEIRSFVSMLVKLFPKSTVESSLLTDNNNNNPPHPLKRKLEEIDQGALLEDSEKSVAAPVLLKLLLDSSVTPAVALFLPIIPLPPLETTEYLGVVSRLKSTPGFARELFQFVQLYPGDQDDHGYTLEKFVVDLGDLNDFNSLIELANGNRHDPVVIAGKSMDLLGVSEFKFGSNHLFPL